MVTRCVPPTPPGSLARRRRAAGRPRADDRGRPGRSDPHHDGRADARRRRRGRDGRAHARRRRRPRRSSRPPSSGEHVRRAGGDVEAGDLVFAARDAARRRRTSECSRASTCTSVTCIPRPRVGVISTGDELVERGTARAGPHSRLQPPDAARARRRARMRSGRRRHRRRRRAARPPKPSSAPIDSCDALLTSGAVSVGDYDFVKLVLDRIAERTRRPVGVGAGRDQTRQAARVRDARPRSLRSACRATRSRRG